MDVLDFDAALERGDAPALRQVVELYRGPLLEGWTEEWALEARTAREQQYLSALDRLTAISLEGNELPAAARWLRLAIACEPLGEERHRSLMQSLADCGDYAAVTQVYRDLRSLLSGELSTGPAPETVAHYDRIRRQSLRPVTLPRIPARRSELLPRRLPVPLTDLIGREEAVDEVSGWLGIDRLVTLTGSGGVGKTRLGIAVGEALAASYPDGVWFVELASRRNPALVAVALAQALGMKEGAGIGLVDTLTERLSDRTLLIILDNCEHLLDACARLADSVLSACPGVKILSTSRQPLGLHGERLYQVPSLRLPPVDWEEEKEVASLMEYPAVRLFMERGLRGHSALRLTRQNALSIVRICRGLDGIPLAIELAAARTNSLSVEEINDCLVERFSLLSGGSRSGSHRHRTLTALIDWSHDLLSIREKALFRRVSVFAGGWSLESAQRVCAGSGIEASETREVLSALVEKSLVIMEPGEEGRSRYRLLETVREYARERVIAAGEECELRARHLDYFFLLAEEADAHRDDKEHKERWLARLKIEHQNLLVGLDWCKSRPERAEAGLRLATSMASFWTMNGLLTEGRACLDDALAHGMNVSPCVRARALHENALLAWHKQDLPTAAFNAEESLRLRRALGDASVLAETLGAAGMVARDMHDFDRARVFFEEALAIHRVREDRYGIAGAFHALGVTAHMQGDLRTARTLYEDGLAIRRERGGITMGYSLGCLCWLHCDIGDYAASRSHHLEALSIFRAHDFDFGIAWCLELHAGLSVVRDQWEKGAILYGAAEALASKLELSMPLTITEGYFALVKAARAELGEEAFAAAWSKGLAMRRDESISFSLDDS